MFTFLCQGDCTSPQQVLVPGNSLQQWEFNEIGLYLIPLNRIGTGVVQVVMFGKGR